MDFKKSGMIKNVEQKVDLIFFKWQIVQKFKW